MVRKSLNAQPSQTSGLSGLTCEVSTPNPKALEFSIRTIAIDNTQVGYIDEGQGPVVVLLHGAPMTSLAFVRVIRELKHKYRVIAPDLPGFGFSDVAPDFAGHLPDYARFVRLFCEHLALNNIILYVNDTSGCFGLFAASQMPQRLAGLVVADTVKIPLTGAAWFVRMVLKYVISSSFVRLLNRRLNLLPWLVAKVAPFIHRFPKVESDEFVRQFDTYDKRDRVIHLLGQLGKDTEFVRKTAKAIKDEISLIPTLILFGQFDPMRFVGSPSCFKKLFVNHTYHIVPWEEHFPILASGRKVAQAVDSWAVDKVHRS